MTYMHRIWREGRKWKARKGRGKGGRNNAYTVYTVRGHREKCPHIKLHELLTIKTTIHICKRTESYRRSSS